MESYCLGKSKYSVVNVEKQDRSGKKWKTTEDHSKWAISYFPHEKAVQTVRGLGSRNRKKWVCVGDINRKIMENNRGGGATCIHSPNIWFEFRRGITAVEECATSTVFKTATATAYPSAVSSFTATAYPAPAPTRTANLSLDATYSRFNIDSRSSSVSLGLAHGWIVLWSLVALVI